jgi:hypothetical protein
VKSIVDPLPSEREKKPYLPNGSSDKAFKPTTLQQKSANATV